MSDLFGNQPWDQEDTCHWLDDNPLPQDFAWSGRAVAPTKRIHHGYGFWLKTTPYHQGLFEEIHRFLADGLYMPTPEEVWQHLREVKQVKQTQRPLPFTEKKDD